MKKFFLVIISLFTLLFSSSAFAADDDWIYAGRFGLLWRPPISHNVDMYLVNHLTTFRGNTSRVCQEFCVNRFNKQHRIAA